MTANVGPRIFRGAARFGRWIPHFRGKYRILNALYSSLARNRSGVLVASLSHPIPYRMLLNLDCAHERLAYCVNGYESDTVLFLMRLWDSSGYFMDIGANVGLISVPFTMLAKRRLAGAAERSPLTVCFEPVASNFSSLSSNLQRNGIGGDVKVFNAAAGAEDKSVVIQVEGDVPAGAGTGTANILPERSTFECVRQPIEVVRIDRLLEQQCIADNCSLIKIDTDGYDLFALQGAVELVRKSRPIIFGEFAAHCMRWHGHTMDDVKHFADGLGYVVLVRQLKGGAEWKFRCPNTFEGFVQDALLVPAEKLDSCRWCITST